MAGTDNRMLHRPVEQPQEVLLSLHVPLTPHFSHSTLTERCVDLVIGDCGARFRRLVCYYGNRGRPGRIGQSNLSGLVEG